MQRCIMIPDATVHAPGGSLSRDYAALHNSGGATPAMQSTEAAGQLRSAA